jgi:hypothetical protein
MTAQSSISATLAAHGPLLVASYKAVNASRKSGIIACKDFLGELCGHKLKRKER